MINMFGDFYWCITLKEKLGDLLDWISYDERETLWFRLYILWWKRFSVIFTECLIMKEKLGDLDWISYDERDVCWFRLNVLWLKRFMMI